MYYSGMHTSWNFIAGVVYCWVYSHPRELVDFLGM